MENPSFAQQWKLASTAANYWIIFIPPLIFAALIIWLSLNELFLYKDPQLIVKNKLEEAALHVTSGFCFLCLLRFLYSKDQFFLWSSGLIMLLFIREIHPPIADYGVYIGLLWFFYYAYKHHRIVADYIRNTTLITMLGAGFFTYVLSVTTDERVWSFVPGEMIWHTKLEETLELLGHVLIGSALLFAKRKPAEKNTSYDTKAAN